MLLPLIVVYNRNKKMIMSYRTACYKIQAKAGYCTEKGSVGASNCKCQNELHADNFKLKDYS